MGKPVELPGGVYATEADALNALAVEARRRKISYGNLVASTTAAERSEIIRQYCAGRRRRKKGG
jgi:hypothetical protein